VTTTSKTPSALPSRRQLLTMIGMSAGSATSLSAMAALGVAEESTYAGPVKLSGAPKGASVLILGAGVAGLVAALELRAAGYKVQVLEFNNRPGGRNWSLRGGDRYTELGGVEQHCEFEKDLYINPGPWRIPSVHAGLIDYCKRLNVALEPFMQVNYNAYIHNTKAYGGKPQRFRHVQADYYGNVAELLSKVTAQGKLDETLTKEDMELLTQSLRGWGALDANMKYGSNVATSERRGYEKRPGGGLSAAPVMSKPGDFKELLNSRLWASLATGQTLSHHTNIFQPVGGMDSISKAFARELGSVIRYNAKVTAIKQDASKVTVTYQDTTKPGALQQATADWCVNTIPLSILSQIEMNVGQPMKDAINAVPYSPSTKVGLQFKRRFWEEDEQIYGGITYTDLPISQISYPSSKYFSKGKGVLLGAYTFGRTAVLDAAMSSADRVKKTVVDGAKIHPQYLKEFENGIAVSWHRVPWTLGCSGAWTPEARAQHYNNLCAIDGRIVLAGEHASFIPAWQEGAVLSSLDAIKRLHERATAA
jgi:monoamine oxidase